MALTPQTFEVCIFERPRGRAQHLTPDLVVNGEECREGMALRERFDRLTGEGGDLSLLLEAAGGRGLEQEQFQSPTRGEARVVEVSACPIDRSGQVTVEEVDPAAGHGKQRVGGVRALVQGGPRTRHVARGQQEVDPRPQQQRNDGSGLEGGRLVRLFEGPQIGQG